MLTTMDRMMLVIYLVLAGALILVATQAIVTMQDMSVSLRQTQAQHEQMLKDHQSQMQRLSR
jgi:cell division protein FtsL